jgi:hypothetical protein
MTWAIDCIKHAARTTEARRRIALAAALNESAATDGDAAAILAAGLRALLWLDSGTCRAAATTLIDGLVAEHGAPAVLYAAIEACRTRPPGPVSWMRHACRQHSVQLSNRPIIKGENYDCK